MFFFYIYTTFQKSNPHYTRALHVVSDFFFFLPSLLCPPAMGQPAAFDTPAARRRKKPKALANQCRALEFNRFAREPDFRLFVSENATSKGPESLKATAAERRQSPARRSPSGLARRTRRLRGEANTFSSRFNWGRFHGEEEQFSASENVFTH